MKGILHSVHVHNPMFGTLRRTGMFWQPRIYIPTIEISVLIYSNEICVDPSTVDWGDPNIKKVREIDVPDEIVHAVLAYQDAKKTLDSRIDMLRSCMRDAPD